MACEELRLPLPESRKGIHAWLCPGDPKRVVVLGHGIGLSKSASLPHAKFLHDAGYTVCLFDHRNHGTSGQDRAWWSFRDRFTTDVATVVNHLREQPEHADARFAVYGFSFSSFPAFYVPTRECPVDAIVCDSGPALDIPPLFRNFLGAKGLPMPKMFRAWPARGVVERSFAKRATAMLPATEWPPPAEGPYAGMPMLYLAGEQDDVVPIAEVQALAALYPKARAHVLAGTAHLQGLRSSPDSYAATVLDFLGPALA
jgi:alpha-beta hydrolase superfamily lysophospholipase